MGMVTPTTEMERMQLQYSLELEKRIAELEALLRGRDDFIVNEGLWQKFVDQLPK